MEHQATEITEALCFPFSVCFPNELRAEPCRVPILDRQRFLARKVIRFLWCLRFKTESSDLASAGNLFSGHPEEPLLTAPSEPKPLDAMVMRIEHVNIAS
jgi:hypothetical protein